MDLRNNIRTATPSIRRLRRMWGTVLAAGLLAISLNGVAAEHARGHHGDEAKAARYSPYAALDDSHLQHIVHHLHSQVAAPQKVQIADLAKVAEMDLRTLEQQAQQVRARRIRLLLRDTIDRSGLEQLRLEEMQLADQRSLLVDRLLADLVEVMTPQQRAQLAEHVRTRAH